MDITYKTCIDHSTLVLFLSDTTIPCSKCGFDFKVILRQYEVMVFVSTTLVVYGGELDLRCQKKYIYSDNEDQCQRCNRSKRNILTRLYNMMPFDVGRQLNVNVTSLTYMFNDAIKNETSMINENFIKYIKSRMVTIYSKIPRDIIDKIELRIISWGEEITHSIEHKRIVDEIFSYDETIIKVDKLCDNISTILICYIKNSVRDFYSDDITMDMISSEKRATRDELKIIKKISTMTIN